MNRELLAASWNRVLKRFIPENAPPSLARQYRIVVAVVTTFIVVAAAFIPPCWMLGYTGTATGHGAAIVVGAAALVALRRSGPALAAHLTALACCATLVPYITLAGGFEYPFFFWFLIVPVCAGLLGGQRVGLIWSAVIAMVVLIYTTLYTNGIRLPVREMGNPPALLVVSQSLTLVFMFSATMFIFQLNQRWEEEQTRKAIEELEREIRERRAAEEAAGQANRAKSAFLAMMSHELRTPMNGVLGMAQLLLLEDQSEGQRRYTEALRDSGELLMGLLDSVLDFSKIESGHLQLERRGFDLAAVLRSAADLMRSRADQKSLTMTLDLSPDLPRRVVGDELRLRQMVLNLLSNAVKFTDSGTVRLWARPNAEGGTRISVEDTGIGIEEEVQERLFEAFMQADTAITRKYGGTGLGLAIVSSLAEAMGGRITVTSTPHVGSTFTLDLPLPSDASEPSEAPLIERPNLAMKVLIVEDNPVNQMVVSRFLSALGCAYEIVGDGQKAVSYLESASADLVLMDMHMPIMDGLEATRVIRDTLGLSVPVVGLTASVSVSDREACSAAGMNDVLAKPLVMDDLRDTLLQYRARAASPKA